jgi:recombinational DNA repair ATPase RecF
MLSPGQRVHALGISFLSHVPDDKCLLSDDVLDYLDQEHQRLLVEAMLDSGKQVVLTVRDSQMDRLTKALSSSEITTRMGVKWTRAFQLVTGGAG